MAELNRQLQHDSALTLTEYRILVLLSEAPGVALRMSDLAAALVCSRSRLTHQIRRMEQSRLVRRTACEDDGRGVIAHLTQDGLRRLRAAAPGHVAAVRRTFLDLLSTGQLETVGTVFDRVSTELNRHSELETN
ncbi:MarR family winged helix-turn-helix transcriptional regulator [Nocardia stercoris]|uniref:MarR family transcriptional regulator n=1 Tax=Nocardia stercoris TaxID=2483361 RepID=A0A3M2LA37_9NOCA|nr:MarR family transcriptional regulator [Nocardia stercoris]RMI34451.1 MarR family transcriptional regulator [Nocardia stercoris]